MPSEPTKPLLARPKRIPLSEPSFEGNEWNYLRECLDTNWVSSEGPFVERFEAEVADYLGLPHAIATCNGTAALHMALKVVGVLPDEEVLVPALTFIAPANAIRYLGAYPVFVDVESNFWQMDAQKVVGFLNEECVWKGGGLYNRRTARRIRAILPVHILGHPVELDPILEVARRYELVVIGDAAESLGARYKEHPVGNRGDIACLSFNGNKIITCGGGGMIVTQNSRWAAKARYLTTQAKDDPVEYIHKEIGYNYRLTNLQAAVGVAQMERLDHHIRRKREIAHAYQEGLKDAGLVVYQEAPWAMSTYWLNAIRIEERTFGLTRHRLMTLLRHKGIEARPLWHPLHRLAPFAECDRFQVGVADQLYDTVLTLPSSIGLTREDQEFVIASILEEKKGVTLTRGASW